MVPLSRPQHGAQAGGDRRAQVRDVVDLVLVQADPLDQVDLDLVAGRDAADQVGAAEAEVLGDGEQRRDVVAGVGVLGGQERVVEIEFAYRDPVRPGRPLRRVVAADAENLCAPGRAAMRLRLGPRGGDRATNHRSRRYRGVVDDAVDHHRPGICGHGDRVRGDLGDLPRQVLAAGKILGTAPSSNLMNAHKPHSTQAQISSKSPINA